MTQAGPVSSSMSKSNNSIPEALREKMLKFTPPGTIVAPSGELRPAHSTGLTVAGITGCGGVRLLSRITGMVGCSESGSSSDRLLELRPGQQISQAGLKKVCLCFICGGSGLPPVGHQCHALGQLVSRQSLALLPEFHNLVCYLNQIPGSLHFVVTSLD